MDSHTGSRPSAFSSRHLIQDTIDTFFGDSNSSSWLLGADSIEPLPSSSFKDDSVTLEGMAWTNPSHSIGIWKDAIPRPPLNRTPPSRPSVDAAIPAFNDGTTKVLTQNAMVNMGTVTWTLQETNGNSALMIVNDSRKPFVFCEPEGVLTSNLHHAVGILTDHGYVGATYYRMSDGRSTLVAFLWTLEPEPNVEHHMIMFAPYPSSRRPTEHDIIETVVLIDTKDCEFCLARGSSPCSCIGGIRHRPGPSKQHGGGSVRSNAWLRWKHDCIPSACGLKSLRMVLKNHRRNVVLESTMQYHLRRVADQGSSSSCHNQVAKPNVNDISMPMGRTNTSAPYVAIPDHQLGAPPMTENSNTLLGSWMLSSPVFNSTNHSRQQRMELEANAIMTHETSITDNADIEIAISDAHGNPATDIRTASRSSSGDRTPQYAASPCILPAANMPNTESRKLAKQMLHDLEQMVWAVSHHDDCKLCGLTFSRKHDLKRHIKAMHLDERQFGCRCGARFMRKQHLDSHVNTVHLKQANFRCELCSKTYTAASTLRTHVKKHHSEDDHNPRE